jgi:hypothetical protein
MIKYTKYLGVLFLCFFFWYIGNNIYLYYYNNQDPIVTIEGFNDGDFFAGKLTGKITGKHPYKVGSYTVLIDGKQAAQTSVYISC